jgi:hypothetical protein
MYGIIELKKQFFNKIARLVDTLKKTCQRNIKIITNFSSSIQPDINLSRLQAGNIDVSFGEKLLLCNLILASQIFNLQSYFFLKSFIRVAKVFKISK